MNRAWRCTVIALLAGGCDASFSYDGKLDAARVIPADSSGDSGIPTDGAGGSSEAAPADSAAPQAGTLASGSWEGRTGHLGRGSAELYRTAAGKVELRFGADFSTSAVPGPVVVLSSRASLGNRVEPAKGDLDLGALKAASGAQSYPLPGGDGGRRFAWVFCEPFGLEIARAPLKEAK